MCTRSISRCSASGRAMSARALDDRVLVGRFRVLVDRVVEIVTAGVFAAESVELFFEVLEVAEVAIDGCEADVRDLIDSAQLGEHALADQARCDFADALLADLALDFESERGDLVARDRALRDRGAQAVLDLRAVERLAAAIGLDDERHRFFDALVGRVAALAGLAFALATPANFGAVLRHTRLDDFVLVRPAERAAHGYFLSSAPMRSTRRW